MSDPTNAPYDKLTVIHDAIEIIIANMIWFFIFGMFILFVSWMTGPNSDVSGLTFGYGLLILALNVVAIGDKWKSIGQTDPNIKKPEKKKHELL